MSTTSQPADSSSELELGSGGGSSPGGPPGPGPRPQRARARPQPVRARTLERRLLGWLLALTVAPALIVLAVGGWALATSIDLGGAPGPWEEVAESGRQVVELVEPADPADPAVAAALAEHRDALSRSLTQARRWAFLERRFRETLPWLVLGLALALVAIAYAATRRLARQLARPIGELVVAAEHLGRGEPLPRATDRSVLEVVILDRTLRRAAADLEAARDRAVAAERLRVWGEMARRVAHEMKNPLTPLRFAAHRLARPGLAVGEAGYAEVVEVIEEEVARLEDLAAQFGALGRPPEGPATEIDVGELLSSLVETDAVSVTATLVAPPELPPVLGRYDTLFRAFRNVIRNGVEAMESVPEPRLEIELSLAGDRMAHWLDVRIRDNGAGLPPDGSERIFEPDFTTKTRGTGLGLALVRQAVTADGGSVTARSLESGAEFVIRLPVMSPPSEQEPG